MAVNQEVEWQFEASDLDALERWLIARSVESGATVVAGTTDTLLDTYYDTADWRCHRAGFAFRIRQRATEIEATLKSFKSQTLVEGLRSRQEINQSLSPSFLKNLDSFKQRKGAVSDRLRAVCGRSVLRPLFDVQTRRRTFHLSLNTKPVGEVTLDETIVSLGQKAQALTRVEIEVPPLLVDTVQSFVDEFRQACQLTPATQSKFGTGMALGNYAPTFEADLGETHLTAESSIGELAYSVLRQQFGNFLKHEPAVLLGDEPEAIHDMRVATRRLRTALKLFAPYLPARVVAYRAELGWVATLLGAVRDIDVQLAQIRTWVNDAELLKLLLKEREQAWKKLGRALTSPRYIKLVQTFGVLVRRGITPRAGQMARAAVTAPPLFKRQWKKFRQAIESLNAESFATYHAARIRGKRLRYAVEFFAPLYGEASQSLVTRLVAVQDLLGAHQDAQVALPRLLAWRQEHGAALAPQTLWALGELTERYTHQAAELRAQVPAAFKKTRKQWRKFKKDLIRDEAVDHSAR